VDVVRQLPHAFFQRDGNDLFPIRQAAGERLGASFPIW
jgi:hypothetical protein